MVLGKDTPICVQCKVAMRPHKNGQRVKDPAVGEFPSTYWCGDIWKCPGCSCKVMTGFGSSIANPNEDFEDVLEFKWNYKSSTKVNDDKGEL
jgi:hypothetical protein